MVQNNINIPVLGVCVGADPKKRLNNYAPKNWESMVELVTTGLNYGKKAIKTSVYGVRLDSIYEAKCLPFLMPNDLFWVVGIRASES